MKKGVYNLLFALLLIFGGSMSIVAQDQVSLKFDGKKSDASQINVTVVNQKGQPIEGASASITSSANLLTKAPSGVVCPNVNGNTNPTIKLGFKVTGLPANFEFNQLQMDIHALNSAGVYQANQDNHKRQFNITANVGKDEANLKVFGSLYNIDIANNVGEKGNVHKFWSITTAKTIKTDKDLLLTLEITAGPNEGCFIGFSEILLTTGSNVNPDPQPNPGPNPLPAETKIYTIAWKNNTRDFVSEEADGSVVTSNYDISKRIFWKFIPTEKANCFYIQNTATNHYMGSCNNEPSSNSLIKTSTEPVEYYVGQTTQNIDEIKGCFYMTSTDCSNYNNESASPLALNKDKVTSNVITWQAGPNRVGSYWTLDESEDLYEIRPFLPSPAVGTAAYLYAITSIKDKALTMNAQGELSWTNKNDSDEQTWYFVGKSNKQGGYLLVNLKNNKTYHAKGQTETRWNILCNDNGYYFRPNATANDTRTTLVVDGDSTLNFQSLHSKLARKNQVYELPCGTLGEQFIEQMSITGEGVTPMYFPLPTLSGNQIIDNKATKPDMWFTLFTRSKATVTQGKEFTINIHLNTVPLEGQEVYLYCDWNRDGVFETLQKVETAQQMTAKVTVPTNANTGKARLRVRLTDNGLTKADDEVTGQIFDCMLNVVTATASTLTVTSNSDERGTVSSKTEGDNAEAIATPRGNATFICWREGNNILSLDKSYNFKLNHTMHLVGYFSPNTQEDITGIEEQSAEKSQLIKIGASLKRIKIETTAPVKKVLVFSPNGNLVAQSTEKEVNLSHIPTGTYIVKVYTSTIDESAKVLLK